MTIRNAATLAFVGMALLTIMLLVVFVRDLLATRKGGRMLRCCL